ncbi:hypothetical protein B6D60_11080 [candidate division KSB1 bacterium 4484_87]|nr:MAG: hypothetical protein B6D60_11080 [candidate division KSB1 bacterium 4484_87]
MIIDTHAHLCDEQFNADIGQVISRAAQKDVRRIISVSESITDAKKNLLLAQKYPVIFPAAGLFPTDLDPEHAEEMINFIRDNQKEWIAVGEVGLDFWAVKSDEEQQLQREIFRRFILLAKELDIPLNIHSRSAGKYVIQMLLENEAEKVQLHAFDGKASSALPAVEAGYFFSIPPSIIRSRQKQKLVKQLPLDRLLLETDSPVLGPTPGQRNEPENIVLALKKVAEIKEIHEKQVEEAVFENTCQLYGFRAEDFS